MHLFKNVIALFLVALVGFGTIANACMYVEASYNSYTKELNYLDLYDNGTKYCYIPKVSWPVRNMRQEMTCRFGWYAHLNQDNNGLWSVHIHRAGQDLAFLLNKKCAEQPKTGGRFTPNCRFWLLTKKEYC